MEEKRKELLVIFLNFFHLAVLYITICGVFGIRHIRVFYLCVLAVFPFLLYGIRCKSSRFSKFFLLHLAAFAVWGVFLFLGNAALTEKILSAVILVFYECFSFYLQSSGDALKESVLPPAVSVILFAVAFLIQNIVEDTGLRPILAGLTVAYLCLYFLHYYLENYLNFMKVNRTHAGKFQRRKFFHTGVFLTGGYILFSTIILAVCTNRTLGNWLGRSLAALLWFLLSGLQGAEGGLEEAEAIPSVEQAPMMPDKPDVGEPGILLEILDKALGILAFLLILGVLAALVIAVIKWIRSFPGKRHRAAVLEGDSRIQDITESLERNSEKKEKRRLFYGLTFNARIRKTYAGFMRQRKKRMEELLAKELACSTVRECVHALASEEKPADPLIQIYEKARYSEKECDGRDLSCFRQTLNQLRE